MPYSNVNGPVGNPQVAFHGLPDSTQRAVTGLMMDAIDPYWGGAEVVYVKANGSIRMGGLVVLTHALVSGALVALATEVTNTTIMGRPVYVAMVPMTSGQFGWVMATGLAPVNCTASVAADTTYSIVAAGQGGALAAGKQVVNSRVVLPATTTVAKAGCVANAGSLQLQIPGGAGWFIGAYLSGTGIAATTSIVDIDPSGQLVTLSVATSAPVNGTVTATYNNATIFYNVAHLNRPFAQGAIT